MVTLGTVRTHLYLTDPVIGNGTAKGFSMVMSWSSDHFKNSLEDYVGPHPGDVPLRDLCGSFVMGEPLQSEALYPLRVHLGGLKLQRCCERMTEVDWAKRG